MAHHPSCIYPESILETLGRKFPRAMVVFLVSGLLLCAQTSKSPGAKPSPSEEPAASSSANKSGNAVVNNESARTPSGANATNVLPPVHFDSDATLHHLNQVISWYRHATTDLSSVGLPSDTIYQDNTKDLGAQVVKLAFQSARAEADLIKAEQKAEGKHQITTTQEQSLTEMQAKVSTQIDQLQSQIQKLAAEIARSGAARRRQLVSEREGLEGQLAMQKALLEAVEKMASFVETNGEVGTGLEGGINQLARSIPEVLGPTAGKNQKPSITVAPTKPSLANSGGLVSEAVTLYDYMSAVRRIDGAIKETKYLQDAVEQVRNPLRVALRATIQQSQQLSNQPPSTDPQQLETEKQTFDALTERFRQLSGVLMPLSQELVVLGDAKTNFDEWKGSISRESRQVLRSVLFRVCGILGALAVILILSEIWRRVTFRYIGDPRRRRQFLVLRRVVIGFLIAVVLIMGFVSEFSSLATFAGFITAGIAVGLQAVLLSVAAYFFVIGRYGIRVGDRISVAGITGDVVDIGLIRLYLMELAGTGLDFYPTGRLVVFSNSVLFQAGTPLFKQIPGTEYTWHEVVVTIAPQGNHKEAQAKLVAAVNQVYSGYRKEIERQHATVERRVDIQIAAPRPEARLQFADTGLELLVRYPVELRRATDVDEEMTRQVLELIDTDQGLKAAVSGRPKIRSAIKG